MLLLKMNPTNFQEIIDKFNHQHIVVLGDVMLDEYIFGDVHRISPEAPVPVLHVRKREYRLGGAANAAHNLISLGGKCTLIGQVGKDEVKEELVKELNNKKINHYLIEKENYQTIKKTRIIAQNQQVVRIDQEEIISLTTEEIEKIINLIKEINPCLILISDYNKGFVVPLLVEKLKQFPCKIVADPKIKNGQMFKGIYAITPNLKEAQEISGKSEIEEIGQHIIENLNTNLILTRSREGVSCFDRETKEHFYLPAECGEVVDVSGAGDTFASSFALAIASGANLQEGVVLANKAAGIVVGKMGTATVSKEELERKIAPNNF